MATPRKPLKPLRDFVHHVAEFCFSQRDVCDKREYQSLVLDYCNTRFPEWHELTHHDRTMLSCHEIYWDLLRRRHGTPCKLAEWCHLLISNKDEGISWDRWCVHLTAALLDRTYRLIPQEECHGIRLDDGTAFGPGHQRILYDSLDKYMGSHELASYIFAAGVPRVFDYHHVFDSTPDTRRTMLMETLDWWIQFLQEYQMSPRDHAIYGGIPLHDHAILAGAEKLRNRPRRFRAAPYKTTTRVSDSWQVFDSWRGWRRGQRGQWLWLEDGYTREG